MPSEPFLHRAPGLPDVRGVVHHPTDTNGDALVLTHGAGSNANNPLLVGIAIAFADLGFTVLRCDLPFRQARATGPPSPRSAATDRLGLERAVISMRARAPSRVFLGGHSYGGRQATMLAASAPDLVAGLLVLSYPLHPPARPGNLRTAHLVDLGVPALFVHGARDRFGSIDEMRAALSMIPAPTRLVAVKAVGHDLGRARPVSHGGRTLADSIVTEFVALVNAPAVARRA